MRVIKLNLLPEELRAVKTVRLPVWLTFNFFSLPLLFLVLSLALDLVLLIMVMWRDADIKMITNKEKTLYPQREQQRKLEDRLRKYQKLVKRKVSWGEVMNVISDCLPQTGWFTKFDMDKAEGTLVIQGSFYSKEGGRGLTGRFISCLNQHEVISKSFKSVTSKRITQRKIGSTEVQDFYLVFTLAEKK